MNQDVAALREQAEPLTPEEEDELRQGWPQHISPEMVMRIWATLDAERAAWAAIAHDALGAEIAHAAAHPLKAIGATEAEADSPECLP